MPTDHTPLRTALALLEDVLAHGDASLPLAVEAEGLVPFAAALEALEAWGREVGGVRRLHVRQAVAALATYAAEEATAGASPERLALEIDDEPAGPFVRLAAMIIGVRRLANDAATPRA